MATKTTKKRPKKVVEQINSEWAPVAWAKRCDDLCPVIYSYTFPDTSVTLYFVADTLGSPAIVIKNGVLNCFQSFENAVKRAEEMAADPEWRERIKKELRGHAPEIDSAIGGTD